ncbi:transcriptional repressor [Nocardioides caricicola]|uniref:Fur family transcriptional regulator n=1 Tax=Nocardioides caricicola TaxID=634770 RepID=A0ABW0N4A8_9ACTN
MPSPTSESAPAAPRQRSTRQRRALLAELEASEGFRSAQDIYAALRAGGEKVGLATVYRALQALVESGEVDQVQSDVGEAAYRLCSRTHHHHLVCRQCGRTVEIAGPAVEKWANRVAEDNGYEDVSHSVELFGVCPVCQKQARQRK